MKKMLKDALIMFAITLIAGLCLGFVYKITLDPIKASEEKAKQEAYKEVFPNADSFEEDADFANPNGSDYSWNEYGFKGVDIDNALWAKNSSGDVLGLVLQVTTHEGYGGDIVFSMGICNDGTLNGISLLSISETAGLGMNAEKVLKPQYAGKNVPAFTVTKQGSTADSQIDAISGATITSNALTNGVNAGLYYAASELGGLN